MKTGNDGAARVEVEEGEADAGSEGGAKRGRTRKTTTSNCNDGDEA